MYILSKGAIAFEGMTKWVVMLILIMVFVAIFVLFGRQMVDFIIKNLPWRVLIKCDPSIAAC